MPVVPEWSSADAYERTTRRRLIALSQSAMSSDYMMSATVALSEAGCIICTLLSVPFHFVLLGLTPSALWYAQRQMQHGKSVNRVCSAEASVREQRIGAVGGALTSYFRRIVCTTRTSQQRARPFLQKPFYYM